MDGMKKLIALLVALSMSLTTGLALADTDPMAEALARQQVPATAALTSTDFEDRTLEFKFEDKASGMAYEVTLNRQPLSVRKVVSRLQGGRGAQEVSLTKEDAVKALMEMYPAAQLGEVFIEQDDGRFQFLITFTTGDDNVIYRARLHAQNGRLLDLSVKHGAEGAQFIKLGAAAGGHQHHPRRQGRRRRTGGRGRQILLRGGGADQGAPARGEDRRADRRRDQRA